MSRRDLLSDRERQLLFGVPTERDAMARFYTLDRADLDLVAARRGPANQLGVGVLLALLRHPGLAATMLWPPPVELVAYLAEQIGTTPDVLAGYARRPQTLTDHALDLAGSLGLRPPTSNDVPFMIKAAADAAWGTDQGLAIVRGIVAALRAEQVILPTPGMIERAGIAGRARARKRAAAALLDGLSPDQIEKLDGLLTVDSAIRLSRLAWVKDVPVSLTPDHVRELLDKLHFVREIGIGPDAATRLHENRFRQFAKEGRTSLAYLIDRYTPARRRATMAALLIDFEPRLADAAIEMADKLIGNAFTRAKNKQERRYAGTTRDVGRLMRMFRGTIDALV